MKFSRLAVQNTLACGAFALGFMGLIGATVQPAHADDSCVWAFDTECDDPSVGGTGACNIGTDDNDCGIVRGGGGGGGGLASPCPFTNDGDCDEPDGLGLCAWGTDVADCSNPNSNFGFGAPRGGGGGGGISPIPAAPRTPAIPSTQEGVQIQTALNYFGFNAGGVDGQIGAGTRAAISRFQTSMGFANTGNMPADQLGLLLGGYTWATTQGGAAQTGQGGIALLQAYRARLAAPVAPAPVVPTLPAPVAAPQVATPVVPQRPQGTTPPTGGMGSFAGLTAGGGASNGCPTPQTSNGFTLVYNGYVSDVFPGNDGGTDTWTGAFDDSFFFEIGTNAMGMRLFGWDLDDNGEIIAGTDYDTVYTGPAIPPIAVGSYWEGTEEVRNVDGTISPASPVRAQIFDEISLTIGACTYAVYRGAVTRPTPGSTVETNRYYLHFPTFGINVFVGEALSGVEPVTNEIMGIEVR